MLQSVEIKVLAKITCGARIYKICALRSLLRAIFLTQKKQRVNDKPILTLACNEIKKIPATSPSYSFVSQVVYTFLMAKILSLADTAHSKEYYFLAKNYLSPSDKKLLFDEVLAHSISTNIQDNQRQLRILLSFIQHIPATKKQHLEAAEKLFYGTISLDKLHFDQAKALLYNI